MNNHNQPEPPERRHSIPLTDDPILEKQIEQTLKQKAEHIRFTPGMRIALMQRIQQQQRLTPSLWQRWSPAFILSSIIIILLATSWLSHFIVSGSSGTGEQPTLTFVDTYHYPTPDQLAHGGQPVSLDPQGQYLVYSTQKSGEMYITSLNDPLTANTLAMEDAQNASWSPDSSALIAIIYPTQMALPLLAIVPHNGYMRPLKMNTLAADWQVRPYNRITYMTFHEGQAKLWQIQADGKHETNLGSMDMPVVPQRLCWSPNGRYLVIQAIPGHNPDRTLLEQGSRTLYLYDTRDNTLQKLVEQENSTLDILGWSPNSHYLAYQQTSAQGKSTIAVLNMTSHHEEANITLKGRLEGMSWGSESNILIYSDNGVLHGYDLSGKSKLVFTIHTEKAIAPLWLDSQHILYLAVDHYGTGQLARLSLHKA